jgi:bifunctional non-homologous end joining protein LigD
MLRFIEPQLASPVGQPPEGKHWIHEIKHDGYRTLLIIEGLMAK